MFGLEKPNLAWLNLRSTKKAITPTLTHKHQNLTNTYIMSKTNTTLNWIQDSTSTTSIDFSNTPPLAEKVYISPTDLKTYLSHKYAFRYNLVKGRNEILLKSQWVPVTDRIFHSIYQEIKDSGGKVTKENLLSILTSDYVKEFDPFIDYFTNLTPPVGSASYIDEIADRVSTTNPDYWKKSFKKWMVATVACAINPKIVNQSVLIIQGAQGLGKSSFFSNLLPEELRCYQYSGNINPDNKDTIINLSENIFINLDELSSLTRFKESALKEIITKESILVRRPYATYSENLVRRASFVGSVNDLQILSDPTGSRRFLIHAATSIDYTTSIDHNRLWAEAYALYVSGFKFYFDGAEILEINTANSNFEIISPLEETLLRYYQPGTGLCVQDLTATEILRNLSGGRLLSNSKSEAIQLGKALVKHGFTSKKVQGRTKYVVSHTKNPLFELKNK